MLRLRYSINIANRLVVLLQCVFLESLLPINEVGTHCGVFMSHLMLVVVVVVVLTSHPLLW